MLIVDDASPDSTGAIADAGLRHRAHLRHAPRARAGWAAHRRPHAPKQPTWIVFQMDADLSHNPDTAGAVAATADVVIGSRYLNGVSVVNWPLHRIFLSAFANRYIRLVTSLTPRDCTSGFRCWRREALARLPLRDMVSDGYAFLVEMLFEPPAVAAWASADHLHRAQGAIEGAGFLRNAHHAVAAAAAGGRRADRSRSRRDGDEVVPGFPGDSVGALQPIGGRWRLGTGAHCRPWHRSCSGRDRDSV
jgi:hypothetical protein